MKRILAALAILGAVFGAHATCTTTINPPTTTDSSYVANVAGGMVYGQTLCLNGGYYGMQNFANLNWSATQGNYLTIQSNGTAAVIEGTQLNNVKGVWFKNIDFTDQFYTIYCAKNFKVSGSHLRGMNAIKGSNDNDGSDCGNLGANFTGNVFDGNVSPGSIEGRLTLVTATGVQIISNDFPQARSDGIQVNGGFGGVVINANTFEDITQYFCDTDPVTHVHVNGSGPHCDAIQTQSSGGVDINGNWFVGNSSPLGFYDGSLSTGIKNNIFDAATLTGVNMQFGGAVSMYFNHNTVYGYDVQINVDHNGNPSKNVHVSGNVFDASSTVSFVGGISTCLALYTGVPCTEDYDMYNTGFNPAYGAHDFAGTPLYKSNNAHPTTVNGWYLKTTSPGHAADGNGLDLGICSTAAPC